MKLDSTATGLKLRAFKPADGADTIHCLAWSPDGAILAATHRQSTATRSSSAGMPPDLPHLYCAATLELLRVVQVKAFHCVFAPDGATMATSGTMTGDLCGPTVFDVSDGATKWTPPIKWAKHEKASVDIAKARTAAEAGR